MWRMRVLLVSVALLVVLTTLNGWADVPNGDFETLTDQGTSADWSPLAPAGVGVARLDPDAHSGVYAMRIERIAPMSEGIVGLNSEAVINGGEQGAMLAERKGVITFWYKALSGTASNLAFEVIPMSAKAFEDTGAPRTSWKVPESAVGDSRWHQGVVAYDYSDAEDVKWVLIAFRIRGDSGAVLLDDIHYISPKAAGGVPELSDLKLVDSRVLPGVEGTLTATVKNVGFAAFANTTAVLTGPKGLTMQPAQILVPSLAVGEKAQLKWQVRGLREKPGRLTVNVKCPRLAVEKELAFAPQLEIRRFDLANSLLKEKGNTWLTFEVANTGHALATGLSFKLRVPKSVKASYAEGKTGMLKPGEVARLRWLVNAKKITTWDLLRMELKGSNLPTVNLSTPVIVQSNQWQGESATGGLANSKGALFATDRVRVLFSRSKSGFSPGILALHKADQISTAWTRMAVIPYLARLVVQGPKGPETYIPWFDLLKADGDQLSFTADVKDSTDNIWHIVVKFEKSTRDDCIQVTHTLSAKGEGKLLAFDGPMLYAGLGTFGTEKRQAVFPGLEWLVDGEVSSSTLDISADNPDQMRYVPDPRYITVPWMSVTNQAGTTGLLWDCKQKWDDRNDLPPAVFAAPDRFNRVDGNLMGLFLPGVPKWVATNTRQASKPYLLYAGKELKLSAQLFASPDAQDPLVAQDAWFALYGVPDPLMPQQGDWAHEVSFAMHAYLDSLWIPKEQQWWTSKGNAIMSTKAIPSSYLYWLKIGSLIAPDAPISQAALHRLGEVIAQHPVPIMGPDKGFTWANPVLYVQGSLTHVMSLLDTQDKRGAWTYDGDRPGSGPFVDYDYNLLGKTGSDALGLNTQPVLDILQYIALSGDRSLLPKAELTLNFLKRFRVPRAAQVWEVPLHSPDILAAAQAVQAYVLGWQLTGKAEYLTEAKRWARTGLPFIYVWNPPDMKMLRYASIPVFGASQFRASWFGQPVQWNGLDYADALRALAPYDKSFPWKKIAEGITVSATYQQETNDPETLALWPDNFSVLTGDKCGWVFNPNQILKEVVAFLGRPAEPDLRVVRTGDGFVHLNTCGRFEQGGMEGQVLQVSLAFNEHQAGWLMVAGCALPTQVQVDGSPVARRPMPAGAIEPGTYWVYSPSSASVLVHFGTAGKHRVSLPITLKAHPLPDRRTTLEFNFDSDSEGWLPEHSVGVLDVQDGCLVFDLTGGDPYMSRINLRVAGDSVPKLHLRMKVESSRGQYGEWFWGTAEHPGPSEERKLDFPMQCDGQFHEYVFDMTKQPDWSGQTITSLRFDPGTAAPAHISVDYIKGGTE